jgi:aminoglycoside phosphotransferase (APT) family kinase protein
VTADPTADAPVGGGRGFGEIAASQDPITAVSPKPQPPNQPAPQDPRGLDLDRVRAFLDESCPGLVAGPLTGTLIQGGKSNLTYVVGDGAQTWVVRRPPLGHVLSTAHDMSREFTVMTALGPTEVPVPRTVAICRDPEVLGAPFYVMEHVAGAVYRTGGSAAALGRDRFHAIMRQLASVLADLHAQDPASIGLADFGRPDGYLERQLRRWARQLDSSRNRPLEGIDELHAKLVRRLPAGKSGGGVVHGDYRLDNVIVGGDDRIAAVLDWEMATLGDPLTDLGLLLMYWRLMTLGLGTFGDQLPADAPTAAQLTGWYADRAGQHGRQPADLADLGWYEAFACYKLAVILEGIHFRYVAGQTVGDGFKGVGAMVPALVTIGHDILQEA